MKYTEKDDVFLFYSEKMGSSSLFLPYIWIDFFSKERKFWLKTPLGAKILMDEDNLRKLNLKLYTIQSTKGKKDAYKHYMSINSPRRASKRIPLLAISSKLNKIWRGKADVRKEYEKRRENGYTYWGE
jgi:hypothetical protein